MQVKKLLDRRFYPEYSDGWTSRLYRKFVSKYLNDRIILLDYGAGRGAEPLHGFQGLVARAVGVDLDKAVLANPYLEEAHVMPPSGAIPYPNDTFDVVVSANVMEHVKDPTGVLHEIRRVLRPGGVFIFKTPNRRHYVPTIARLTPHRFHLWINRRRGLPDCDTFPTVYRYNTPDTVKRLAERSEFEVEELETIEGRPEYLRAFPLLYPLGILYERAVNAFPALASFRVVMLGALRKPNSVT